MSVHAMTAQNEQIFQAVSKELEGQPHLYGASAGANVLDWFQKNGMQLIQAAVTFIPGGTAISKYVPIVLGVLQVLKDNGAISDAPPAA